MARSKRIKRRARKRINWFFIFLVILFTFTFKSTSFDTEPTIFINSFVFKSQPIPSFSPTPINVDVEFSEIEKMLENGQLLLAKDKLDRLMARGVAGGRLHFLLGILYDRMSKEYTEKAISEFRMSSLYKSTKNEALYELGKLYFMERLYKDALEVFTKIKDNYERDPLFLKYLGISYIELGKYKKGKKVLEEAIKLAPKDEEMKEYLGRIKMPIPPSPTPTVEPIAELSPSPSLLQFGKKLVTSYFEMGTKYNKDIFIVSEDISFFLSLDGSYKESVHRILVVKNPDILRKGIRFRYNKKYVTFSLFLLRGFSKDGEEIPEDKFDYIIETHKEKDGISYEDAIISFDAKGPIVFEYRAEVRVKPVIHGKFQFLFSTPNYPIKKRKIEFSIPQGLSFNVYPKDNLHIKDEKDYKKVLFNNSSNMILLNNFTTWKDVWDYGESILKNKKISFSKVKKDPENIYNNIVPYYYETLEKKDAYFLFKDPIYSPLQGEEGNLLLTILLFEVYNRNGFKVEPAILESDPKISFPFFSPSTKSLLFLDERKIYIEPYPFLVFGVLEPNIMGKKVYLLNTEKSLRLPFVVYNKNTKEDYLKVSLSSLDSIELISYTQGLFDFFYRNILYHKRSISHPTLWFLAPDLSIYKTEPSDIKRLDVPFQVVLGIALKKRGDDSKFLPPYIYPTDLCRFPFIIKRRIEISLDDYRVKEIPDDIIVNREGFSYEIKFSLSSNKKKIFIINTFILKNYKGLSQIGKIKEAISKAYILLSK